MEGIDVVATPAPAESPKPSPGLESPSSSNVSKPPSKQSSNSSPQVPPVPNFPPPKTDKPRPHVCTTCGRSFARLEHLKRHERSHTKEKPFECQACTRCFARRDLLLRHQQKLHSATTPSSRPRNGRRESAAGVANGRVRKNSMSAPTTNNAMRPRANTLSHIDTSTLGSLSGSSFSRPFTSLHTNHTSFGGINLAPGYPHRGMGMAHMANMMGLSRLDTTTISLDMSPGLRTAPPYGGFGAEFDMDMTGYGQIGSNTINPHELHTPSMHGLGIDNHQDFHTGPYSNISASQAIIDDDGVFDWVTQGFESQMSFINTNENAIESSPSAMDTNSPANFQDTISRMNSQQLPGNTTVDGGWQMPQNQVLHSPLGLETNSMFAEISSNADNTISPKSLMAQNNGNFDANFSNLSEISTTDNLNLVAVSDGPFGLPFKHDHFASNASSASMDSSMRQSSVVPHTNELVSDRMRIDLIAGLSVYSGFGQRRSSVPTVSSPLSPAGNTQTKVFNAATFPSTAELQRYVSAYFRFCHPHLPFLHLPTLNFESGEYRSYSARAHHSTTTTNGGGCLLLSIAAMGALMEHEHTHSQELFEYSKRMISSCLEERRIAHMHRAPYAPHHSMDVEDTPLWLVQAMLLNVVYGHNCGDKTAADIASNQCASLVSLARGAELSKPYAGSASGSGQAHDGSSAMAQESGDPEWFEWKIMEERKRTLYSVFVLSSMLVMAYNRAPALTNSEIRLDLPCDEELWMAESGAAWRSLGGIGAAQSKCIPFARALTHLLTAAQRERQAAERFDPMNNEAWQQVEHGFTLNPSSFGCLVLIDALHNYIWETRQRHLGKQWTTQDVEAMHAHIEPALRAWSAAWSSNPLHVIERPNPFGAGPLPADSIPLLDLAYVRLFVDFGRSKEAYWHREYDTMAQELAKGPETGYIADPSNHGGVVSPQGQGVTGRTSPADNVTVLEDAEVVPSSHTPAKASRRERHLRKAAFYAADHLMNADRLGIAFAEKTSRDLPMQSILCACDCAQVLSEWVTTLQERIGKYVGVIGRDEINLREVPAILMLDEEDLKLLDRVEELLSGFEQQVDHVNAVAEAKSGGYASRILVLTSQTMAKAALWPVTTLMAQSLEIQAGHVKSRVLASV